MLRTNIFCKIHVECCACRFSNVHIRIIPFCFSFNNKLLNRQYFFDFFNDFVDSFFSIQKWRHLFVELFDWIHHFFDVVNIWFLILFNLFFKFFDCLFHLLIFFKKLWDLCVKNSIVHCLIFDYKIASFLYRSYGSRMFLEVNVSSNRSRTSSRNAFSDNQTVVISCSAIIWFWNNVWIARCVVFLNSSRLIDSLLPCWLFGRMWWTL